MTEHSDFGTPEARDATARSERTVIEAAQYAASLDDAIKEDVQNRELGSVRISPQDQASEYELMRENPIHMAQFFADSGATVEQMIQYAKDMEKKRG